MKRLRRRQVPFYVDVKIIRKSLCFFVDNALLVFLCQLCELSSDGVVSTLLDQQSGTDSQITYTKRCRGGWGVAHDLIPRVIPRPQVWLNVSTKHCNNMLSHVHCVLKKRANFETV